MLEKSIYKLPLFSFFNASTVVTIWAFYSCSHSQVGYHREDKNQAEKEEEGVKVIVLYITENV